MTKMYQAITFLNKCSGFMLFVITICLSCIFVGCHPKDAEKVETNPRDAEKVETNPRDVEKVETNPKTRTNTNDTSSVEVVEPRPQITSPDSKITNRLTKYQESFNLMDREKYGKLVIFSPDQLTKYYDIEYESPEYDQLLNILDSISQAAFHEASLDWLIDFSKFPDLEAEHWKYIQHASLIIQWWVHRSIMEGDVETAYQILQIGLKLADDVFLDKTLPGALLAMQIRDELCQVIIDDFHAISSEQAGKFISYLMPHIISGNSWVAQNYTAAQIELEWFISKTKELQEYAISTNGEPNLDLLPKGFFMAFYTLKGFVDPVDQAILKGVPASELEKDPAKAYEIITKIQLQVGREYALEFLSRSPQQVESYFSEIRILHKKLGELIALDSWENFLAGFSEISKELQSKIFLWNHSVVWIKARKMEYLSRLKFSLLLNGLINHSGQVQFLPKAANPITGSIPVISPFVPDEKELGFFAFVDGLPRSTYSAFAPFHQILFITEPNPKYHGYGIKIGHPVE